jgi:hypothetical protein
MTTPVPYFAIGGFDERRIPELVGEREEALSIPES